MAQNRNPRWRPSAVLDLLHHHVTWDHPQSLFIGPHRSVKFYANPMHSFEDMTIWIFFADLAWNAYSRPKILVFGVWTHKFDWSSSRPPKRHIFGRNRAYMPILVEIGPLVRPGREPNESKRRGKKLTVVVVVVVVEYLYSASRSASNALIVPQRCEEMCL